MFALVHGAGAHVFSHDRDERDHGTTITIGHGAPDEDCPDADVRVFDNDPDDSDPWDEPATDPFDHDVD